MERRSGMSGERKVTAIACLCVVVLLFVALSLSAA